MFEITTYPTTRSLTIESAKRHLNIAQSNTSFDDVINEQIDSAQILMFDEARVLAAPMVLTEYCQRWADMSIYMDKITTVTITYLDEAGDVQPMVEGTDYLKFKGYPTRIQFLETPELQDDAADTITVVLTGGYVAEASTPPDVLAALRFIVGDLFEIRQSNTKTGNEKIQPRSTDWQLGLINRRIGL